ncbi:hypothetical protein SAY87_002602 [Trapa incisa]|uniref:Nucleolar protein 12 n=1 Tax=Trapa incisa TaxID=236973 RepID=A0AAN7JUB4_9MYRT|nr:hypothetical protein SAY87_002602 [Trapa incisa]
MDDTVEAEEESQLPRVAGRHIKKRALKNKSLSITFNEKDLRDFVSGFHKRKKKRRKEAQKKQEEALRRKRIEQRKKRKLEKEFALYGVPSVEPGENDMSDHCETDQDMDHHESPSGTLVYDTSHMKVTVTTSEISPVDESITPEIDAQMLQNRPNGAEKRNSSLAVKDKKSFKRVAKQKPRRSSHKKRDKNKKIKKKNKRKHH